MQEEIRKLTSSKEIPQPGSILFQPHWNNNNDQQREPNHSHTLRRYTTDQT